MLGRLRACDPSEPLSRIIFYRTCRKVCAIAVRLIYRLRVVGAANVPPATPEARGLLLVANHQSHLDPPLIGVALGHRNMASLARIGLFGNRFFAWLLRVLGSISIRQGESDTAAIRAAIGELKKGRIVLIFPEGSRSPDGSVHEFKRGTWLLLSRAGCDVLPAAVEGAFAAWPRTRTAPRIFGQRCAVAFGEPIPFERLSAMGADEALRHLQQVIEAMRVGLSQGAPRADAPASTAPQAAPPRA